MNPVSWFEIPVSDMERAVKFYNTVMGWNLKAVDLGQLQMAWMPMDREKYGASGALVKNENYTPQTDGTLIYLQCADVSTILSKVDLAGGKTLINKRMISPEFGFMGLALDSEGNRIAFHSPT